AAPALPSSAPRSSPLPPGNPPASPAPPRAALSLAPRRAPASPAAARRSRPRSPPRAGDPRRACPSPSCRARRRARAASWEPWPGCLHEFRRDRADGLQPSCLMPAGVLHELLQIAAQPDLALEDRAHRIGPLAGDGLLQQRPAHGIRRPGDVVGIELLQLVPTLGIGG